MDNYRGDVAHNDLNQGKDWEALDSSSRQGNPRAREGSALCEAGSTLGRAAANFAVYARRNWFPLGLIASGTLMICLKKRSDSQPAARSPERRLPEMTRQNPAAAGILAFFSGFGLSFLLPHSPSEDRLMGSARDRLMGWARSEVSGLAQDARQGLRDIKTAVREETFREDSSPTGADSPDDRFDHDYRPVGRG